MIRSDKQVPDGCTVLKRGADGVEWMCGLPVFARGMCEADYRRFNRAEKAGRKPMLGTPVATTPVARTRLEVYLREPQHRVLARLARQRGYRTAAQLGAELLEVAIDVASEQATTPPTCPQEQRRRFRPAQRPTRAQRHARRPS